MFPQAELDNYKLQVELLQEKLGRSEENRQQLEQKLQLILHKRSEHDKAHRLKTRQQYQEFLDEQRQRNERNKVLVATLDRIDQQTAALSARSERLRMMKIQYEMYFARLVQSQAMQCLQNAAATAAPVGTPIPVLLPCSGADGGSAEAPPGQQPPHGTPRTAAAAAAGASAAAHWTLAMATPTPAGMLINSPVAAPPTINYYAANPYDYLRQPIGYLSPRYLPPPAHSGAGFDPGSEMLQQANRNFYYVPGNSNNNNGHEAYPRRAAGRQFARAGAEGGGNGEEGRYGDGEESATLRHFDRRMNDTSRPAAAATRQLEPHMTAAEVAAAITPPKEATPSMTPPHPDDSESAKGNGKAAAGGDEETIESLQRRAPAAMWSPTTPSAFGDLSPSAAAAASLMTFDKLPKSSLTTRAAAGAAEEQWRVREGRPDVAAALAAALRPHLALPQPSEFGTDKGGSERDASSSHGGEGGGSALPIARIGLGSSREPFIDDGSTFGSVADSGSGGGGGSHTVWDVNQPPNMEAPVNGPTRSDSAGVEPRADGVRPAADMRRPIEAPTNGFAGALTAPADTASEANQLQAPQRFVPAPAADAGGRAPLSIENIENAIYGELVPPPAAVASPGLRSPTQGVLENFLAQPQPVEPPLPPPTAGLTASSEPASEALSAVDYVNDAAALQPDNGSGVGAGDTAAGSSFAYQPPGEGEAGAAAGYDPTYAASDGSGGAAAAAAGAGAGGDAYAAAHPDQGAYSADGADQQQQQAEYDYGGYDASQYAGAYEQTAYPGYTYDAASGQYIATDAAQPGEGVADAAQQQYAAEDGAYTTAAQQEYEQQQYEEAAAAGGDYDYASYAANPEAAEVTYSELPDMTAPSKAAAAAAAATPAAADEAPPAEPKAAKAPTSILATAAEKQVAAATANEAQKKKKRVNFVDSSETDESSSVRTGLSSAVGSAPGPSSDSDFDFSTGEGGTS